MKNVWRWVWALTSLTALVGCDHATKYIAKAELEYHPPKDLIRSVLDLRYVENTDVGFNLLHWVPANLRGPLLLVVGALAIFGLIGVLFRLRGTAATRAGFVLILAGALGNYSDRVIRGYVVDFIHVTHWPVFNVADICVTLGVAFLLWSRFAQRHDRHPA